MAALWGIKWLKSVSLSLLPDSLGGGGMIPGPMTEEVSTEEESDWWPATWRLWAEATSAAPSGGITEGPLRVVLNENLALGRKVSRVSWNRSERVLIVCYVTPRSTVISAPTS